MTLSIISISQNEFISQAAKIPSGDVSLQLSFESEKEVLLAKQALMISKICPAVFSAFPDFRQFDPTLSLPSSVREKAVRICPKSLFPSDTDDVTGVVSSLYAGDGSLMGSLINAAFDSPLSHAFTLYALLSSRTLGIRVKYESIAQRVNVNILKKGVDMGFWFDCKLNQIQTFDLQHSLEGKGYLGLAFPVSSGAYQEFMNDTEGNTRSELPDGFFEKQIVNDWLIFHLSGEKIVRQSFELQGKTMLYPKPGSQFSKVVSTKQWLTVPSHA